MLPTFCSIDEILRYRAQETPEAIAYTFLSGSAQVEITLAYALLDERARAIAHALQRGGFESSRALLMFDPGPGFASAFFGCLYAGVVAVPVFPPHRNRGSGRVRAVARDCEPAIVLLERNVVARLAQCRESLPELDGVPSLDIDDIGSEDAAHWHDRRHAPETTAFLQYTSGSTATPKGVVLSHGNILHNQARIRAAFEHDPDSVVVGWLPLFHDMGLIGNLLQPMYVGCSCILMPPTYFLQRPIRWLQAISRYRATTSGGPNFAYDLCVDAIAPHDCEGLDLSCWGLAFNGAERVRAETVDRFSAAFAHIGFRASAFYPCYGLAEGTLIVAGGRKSDEIHTVSHNVSANDGPGSRLVGCGEPLPGHQVRIVDPERAIELANGAVGEIWISGGNVASGYWKRTPTEQDFVARLPGDDAAYFRTGDLGFIEDGELFVTGRAKDVIILRGRNVYPEDLEITVTASNAQFRPYGCAVVAAEKDGREIVGVLVEILGKGDPDFDALRRGIERSLTFEHDVVPDCIIFLRPQAIPKTSSGKIQRHICREMMTDPNVSALRVY